MLNHNLGKLSDKIFDTLQEGFLNKETSFTTDCWTKIIQGKEYLSSSFKQHIPIVGNRLCKNSEEKIFYLIIDYQGQILSKIRL